MRKVLNLLSVLVFLLSAVVSEAQNITVHVEEQQGSREIAVAYVNIYTGDKKLPDHTEITDDNGNVRIMASFPCRMEVSAIGYETFSQTLAALPDNRTYTVQLSKKSAALNEYVITGLAQPVARQDALSLYRVISREALASQGSVSLADALSTQLNININNDAVLGSGISMQGMSGDKVKILVDGIPVNGREGGNIDLGQINLNNIDHIEIVQGPMSVMYGTDAIGGVINLITKKNVKPISFQAGFNYESVGKYNVDANASLRLNKRSSITVGGARNFFQGWKYNDTLLQDKNSGQRYPAHRSLLFKPKEQYIANVAYTYTSASGFRLQLASDFMHEKVTDYSAPSIFTSFGCYALDNYYRTTRFQARLLMDGKLGKNGHWQSQNGYSVYHRRYNTYIKDMVTLEETLTPQQDNLQDTSLFEDINLRSSYSNKIGKISYTAGYDIGIEHANTNKIPERTKNIEDYAVYVNASVPLIGEKLIAQPGLRAAYNTNYHAPLVPSLNLLYHAGEHVQLRASYGKGFRAPTLKELYLEFFDVNHHITGNPDLRAENSDNFQASASYQFYHRQSSYMQVIVTGYYNDVRNEIDLVNNEPQNPNSINYSYANISHLRNTIANVQLESQLLQWYWQVGYGYNYTFDLQSSPIGSSFNASEITANVQYLWKKPALKFALFYKFTGSAPGLQNNIDGSATFSGIIPSYHIMDASVSHKFFSRRLEVVAGVKNIFDVQLLSPSGAATAVTANPHGASKDVNLLPRRFFTTIRLNL
ncbi:TonB-dependent receptor plug domain-containing protein [Chitinophagaceae bacterium MMS25-I14]